MGRPQRGLPDGPQKQSMVVGLSGAERPRMCSHHGEVVRCGDYYVLAGGTQYLQPEDLERADVVIPLENRVPARLGQSVVVLGCPWKDFAPPPDGFEQFLRESVIPLLAEGRRLLVYCIGSHGRTGTFVASLIALVESPEETPDPIQAVRERHCRKAVETLEQAESVFSLRGQELPEKYRREFTPV